MQQYIDPNHHAGLCNLHYCIVRMSDIYLMKAEALLKQQGSSNAEIDGLINEVRRRVGLADISNCTMEDIIHERRCEFATEGLRHYDLIRWKLAKQYMQMTMAPTVRELLLKESTNCCLSLNLK